MDDLDKLAT